MDKFYITIGGVPIKLNPVDASINSAIESGMAADSVLFEVEPKYWMGLDTNLPDNPKAVFVSGSDPKIPVRGYDEVKVGGEMAVFREQNNQQKSYRYLLVESGSGQWFFGSEFKNFPEHYYGGSHPTGSIWQKKHPTWPKS